MTESGENRSRSKGWIMDLSEQDVLDSVRARVPPRFRGRAVWQGDCPKCGGTLNEPDEAHDRFCSTCRLYICAAEVYADACDSPGSET